MLNKLIVFFATGFWRQINYAKNKKYHSNDIAVILGKQNWLFYKQTENDYIGKNILCDNDIESIARFGLFCKKHSQ